MTREEIHDLVRLYALNALGDEERAAARHYIESGDPECIAILNETQAISGQLPLALDPITPPARVRDRIVERAKASVRTIAPPVPMKIAAQSSTDRPRRASGGDWFRPLIAAAAAAIIVYFATSLPLNDRTAKLQKQVAQLEGQVSGLQETQDNQNRDLRVLFSPSAKLASLEGDPQGAPRAKAKVFFDRETSRWVMYASGLKPLASGRVYELWYIVEGNKDPVPAGTFKVNTAGEGSVDLKVPKDLGRIALAAVTDEPYPGSGAPTTAILMKGAVEP